MTMKYLFSLVMGFYIGSAQALMPPNLIPTNTGMMVPANCAVWNDGCNDCVRTNEGFECPPRTCVNDFAGYCKQLAVDIDGWLPQPSITPAELDLPVLEPKENPVLPPAPRAPAGCTKWFDGCNTCERGPDDLFFCTERACGYDLAPPRCLAGVAHPTVAKPSIYKTDISNPIPLEAADLELSIWGLIKYHFFNFWR